VDEVKPEPCNGELTFGDSARDQNEDPVATTDSTELTGAFLRYYPARAETTFNIVVKNLAASVPAPYLAMWWSGYYTLADGRMRFVRALLDATGTIAYHYGTFAFPAEPDTLGGFPVYEGDTTGRLFEGPSGIVQLVIPKEDAVPGTTFTEMFATTYQGVAAPAAAPGQLQTLDNRYGNAMDIAPNSGPSKSITYTVGPCQPAAPAGTPAPRLPLPTTAGLSVRLASSSIRAPHGRRFSLGLRASQPIRDLRAKLLRAGKNVGRGSLARLSGKGTLHVRASRRLAKGRYVLSLIGRLADGSSAGAQLKLKLR
jgi:hypothetical protein